MSAISASLDSRLHPIIFAAAQFLVSAMVIGFTPPGSFIRHAVVPLLFYFSYSFMMYAKFNIPSPYGGVASSNTWLSLLNYISMAIISGWNFDSRGPLLKIAKEKKVADSTPRDAAVKMEKKSGSFLERFGFGLHSICSQRDCGLPHEVKNVPPFIYNDPKFVPSAAAFVTRSTVTAIICYFIIDFLESQPAPHNAAEIFAQEKVSVLTRWREITLQEAITRVAASAMFWINMITILTLMTSIFNIICVSLGLSKVENCKPLMGPMSEAYTIRGFWGHAWHQATRKLFATPANFLVDEAFMFQKKSPPNVYSKIFVTFFISGVMHQIADWTTGMDWAASGAIKFFYFQVVGILLEDTIGLFYRLSTGRDLKSPPKIWTRMLGYLWVTFFLLFWTTPGWFYPMARSSVGTEQGKVIPYNFSYFRKYAKQ
ncbi:uncharacterized protein RAG0_12483 [Rhynchosporium agropyri]|uniref:Wax synthase domain-containing protein n=1 Tax=Rhynchosporium agropyri TaxID=914238 RepID=A0A1E1L8M8_9HELO|nr:uncharacterized protein RAG0_12483 [Rhynchosporium agropyri]